MRIGIRVRVLIFFLTVTILVSLFSSLLMYVRYRNIMVDETKQDVSITAEIRNELDDLTFLIEKAGNYISFDQTMIEALHTDVEDGIKRTANITAFTAEFKKTYELLLGSRFSNYFLSFFINPDLAVSEYVEDGSRIIWLQNIFNLYSMREQEDWYRETVNKDGAIHLFRSNDSGDTCIYLSKLIKNRKMLNNSYQEVLGVSVVGIDTAQILQSMERLKITDAMQFAVIDFQQNVVCKSSDEIEDQFILGILEQNIPTASVTRVYETKEFLFNIEKTDMGLYLMSIVPLNDIYLMTREIQSILFLSISVSVILAIVLSLILAASVTKPIERLSDVMVKAKDDERGSLIIQSVTNDEVGDLYKAFIGLLEDLDDKNRQAQELEMKMFQLQINPHFLYNTLDSIAWKAISNKQTEIVDMVECLSEIFKYSVRNNEQFAKLKDEIEVVSKYATLQKNRIARLIDFSYVISPEVEDVMVPKCILQPLVENSILHADSGSEKQLLIQIVAYQVEGKIIIQVHDNGICGDIEKMNQYLKGEETLFPNGEMGIYNVNIRIKLRFGMGSGLHYERNETGGTTAVITIAGQQ